MSDFAKFISAYQTVHEINEKKNETNRMEKLKSFVREYYSYTLSHTPKCDFFFEFNESDTNEDNGIIRYVYDVWE